NLIANSTENLANPQDPKNRIYLMGLTFCESASLTLTLSSATTALIQFKLAANQGIYDKVGGGYLLATKPNEALTVVSTGNISAIVFHIIEARYWIPSFAFQAP
ncbi:MAG: hypothetical protein K2X66_11685, partial [Cyanobacteria bacterium]|nr:hypothetical protein [Cyanobacteriota bacterium]